MSTTDFLPLFDNDPSLHTDYKLVKKIHDLNEINHSKKVIREGKLNVRKKSGKYHAQYYKLKDKKLIYSSVENPSLALGYYDLILFYSIDYTEYEENKQTTLYSFSLKKNGKYHEFFSTQKDKVREWYEILKLFCICNDFKESYSLKNVIGKGHFAKVYKVIKKTSKNEYAAKIMKKDNNFENQKLFIKNEITILKKLSRNEYIVQLYEIYENFSEIILIFELMEGGDLYTPVKSKEKYTEKEAWLIFIQIIKGIEFLHSHGVIHRDIKLQNLMLTAEKRVKLGDFSLAEYYQNKILNVKCGTPGFMAPEIIQGEPYNEKVDIFSCGVVLYIMLSGSIPFKGKDYNVILDKNKKCVIKFKKSDWEYVSHTARKLVTQMVDKNPENRISLTQILTHKFVLKYIYDDSVKEIRTESKRKRDSFGDKMNLINGLSTKKETHEETKSYHSKKTYKEQEEKKHKEPKSSGLSNKNPISLEELESISPKLKSNSSSDVKIMTVQSRPAITHDININSGNSLFISNGQSKSEFSEIMSMSMKSSYSLFSQKFVNGKFRTSSVSGDKSSHSHIDMKNIITSKSNSSSNRGEKSNDEYTEVHSENKYFEIFHESNPLKLQLGRMNEMSKISNSINFSYYKLK